MNEYIKEFTIGSFECDEKIKLRIRSLFNLFQNMADIHADLMGVGHRYCVQNKLAWISGAYDVKINSLPRWNDKVQLKTWPSKTKSATAYREFELSNAATGQMLACASSKWVLVDLNRMRPLPVLRYLKTDELQENRAVDTQFEKLPGIKSVDFKTEEIIRTDDIDLNHHVNNAVYPSWLLDSVPADLFADKMIKNLKIQYLFPAKKESGITVETEFISENKTRHRISNSGKKEYVRAEVSWK